MKLKSLFLASLALVAMASCSNEESVIDDGNSSAEKKALMQIGFTFPASTATRATEAATTEESNFTDAVIVIDQSQGKTVVTVKKEDFRSGTPSDGKAVLYLKDNIAVYEGEATIYVYLNASSELKGKISSDNISSYNDHVINISNYSNDILEAAGNVAEKDKFLMSNANGAPVVKTFVTGVNGVTVHVDRVVAKLIEMSANKQFSVANPSVNNQEEINVTLTGYSFAGLQKDTYVLAQNRLIALNLYNKYNGPTTAYTFKALSDIANEQRTYCLENLNNEAGLATKTNIIYKAQIKVGDTAVGTTLYITPDKKLFKSFDDMIQAGYNFAGITSNSTIEDCLALGLHKYENGICYYVASIKTGNVEKIVRNNSYQLKVNSIAQIGSVLPKTIDAPSLLELSVEVNAWITNLNGFDL